MNERQANRTADASDHLDLIPQALAISGILPVWIRWCKANREARHPITRTMAEEQLALLETVTASVALEMLRTSTRNGWKSLIPPQTASTPGREVPEWKLEKIQKAKGSLAALELAQKRIDQTTHPSSWGLGLKAIQQAQDEIAALQT